jgi:hypothetical protein
MLHPSSLIYAKLLNLLLFSKRDPELIGEKKNRVKVWSVKSLVG